VRGVSIVCIPTHDGSRMIYAPPLFTRFTVCTLASIDLLILIHVAGQQCIERCAVTQAPHCTTLALFGSSTLLAWISRYQSISHTTLRSSSHAALPPLWLKIPSAFRLFDLASLVSRTFNAALRLKRFTTVFWPDLYFPVNNLYLILRCAAIRALYRSAIGSHYS